MTAETDVLRLIAIEETPLDIAQVLASLDQPTDGGVDLFVGRVRDNDGGKGVTHLEYSAHPSAVDQMRAVCEEVAGRHGDVHGISAVHRVGRLAIGEIAVIVGTTAGHRQVTFDATRDLIDTLKSTVPIWKHQVFSDGTDEWVGTP